MHAIGKNKSSGCGVAQRKLNMKATTNHTRTILTQPNVMLYLTLFSFYWSMGHILKVTINLCL